MSDEGAERRRMWAVTRDGEIWIVRLTRQVARNDVSVYSPGSKHKWGVVRVCVSKEPSR